MLLQFHSHLVRVASRMDSLATMSTPGGKADNVAGIETELLKKDPNYRVLTPGKQITVLGGYFGSIYSSNITVP